MLQGFRLQTSGYRNRTTHSDTRHRHFCCALYVAIEVGLYLHPSRFTVKGLGVQSLRVLVNFVGGPNKKCSAEFGGVVVETGLRKQCALCHDVALSIQMSTNAPQTESTTQPQQSLQVFPADCLVPYFRRAHLSGFPLSTPDFPAYSQVYRA